jgi:hypothetical protein
VKAVITQALGFEAVEAVILEQIGQDAADLCRRFPDAGGGTINVRFFRAGLYGLAFFLVGHLCGRSTQSNALAHPDFYFRKHPSNGRTA